MIAKPVTKIKICEVCNSNFEACHNPKKRCCSRRCSQVMRHSETKFYSRNKSVMKKCATCSTDFRVVPHRLKTAKYCSRSCASMVTSKKHGHASAKATSPTYKSWRAMKSRCENKSSPGFKDYGAKGITVCARWQIFNNFFNDMGERPAASSIDRIDNTRGYYKENCKWSSPKEQVRNRRITIFAEINGEIKALAEWSEVFGLSYNRVATRLAAGWPLGAALTIEYSKNNRKMIAKYDTLQKLREYRLNKPFEIPDTSASSTS